MSTSDPQSLPPDLQQRYTQIYLEGKPPWDSGISPPELLEAIRGDAALPPGRALDIGCGTGTNSISMASAGWHVVGVDFAPPAIAQAQAKAKQAQDSIAHAHGSVIFIVADVTRLPPPASGEHKQLLLDLGCLNGIPRDRRPAYAQMLAQQAAPGALFMLYAHLPRADGSGPIGCTPEELDALLGANFVLERREMGQAPQGGASMWNWFRRRG